MDKYLNSFREMISLRGLTDHTLKNYCTYIWAYLDYLSNLKHKAVVSLLYSAELRIGEICRLRYEDISRSSMRIHIHSSKNRSFRFALLAKNTLDILTCYWFEYGRPSGFLFRNRNCPNCQTAQREIWGVIPTGSPSPTTGSFPLRRITLLFLPEGKSRESQNVRSP